MASVLPSGLAREIQPSSIKVHAPSSVIFLCGGLADSAPPQPAESLRAAFLRAKLPAALSNHKIVIAEAAEPMLPVAGYRDLLTFENDIAGAVALILLFSESPGSLAELGAFSAIESVAKKLLVIIDDGYYNESSFIRNGPIAALENNQGDEWVLVLERGHVGISEDRDINMLNYDRFTEAVMPAVEQRLDNTQHWETHLSP